MLKNSKMIGLKILVIKKSKKIVVKHISVLKYKKTVLKSTKNLKKIVLKNIIVKKYKNLDVLKFFYKLKKIKICIFPKYFFRFSKASKALQIRVFTTRWKITGSHTSAGRSGTNIHTPKIARQPYHRGSRFT